MKRIILMYISEISGHHSATLAIEKAIRMLSAHAEILNINAFNYTNPISEKVVNRIYMGVIKATPKIWDYLYDNPRIAKKIESIKDTIHKLNSPKLKTLFDKFKPDAVICTQAFPCGMVADFKKTYNSPIRLVAVLTDYIPHSYWIYDTVDYYITPSEEVGIRLKDKGVESARIESLGIPFDPGFNDPVVKDKVIHSLNLIPHLPVILIMGGGQGLGPIKSVVSSLEKAQAPFQEVIVTGTNKKLYNSLKKKARRYKRKIVLLSYVHNIHELMSISDMVITKPGGVTTAEALSKGLAMIIIKPIPGQEASNTQYLMNKGAALKIDEPGDTHILIDSLFGDPERLKQLRASARLISKPTASLDIARLILNFSHSRV